MKRKTFCSVALLGGALVSAGFTDAQSLEQSTISTDQTHTVTHRSERAGFSTDPNHGSSLRTDGYYEAPIAFGEFYSAGFALQEDPNWYAADVAAMRVTRAINTEILAHWSWDEFNSAAFDFARGDDVESPSVYTELFDAIDADLNSGTFDFTLDSGVLYVLSGRGF